jgi:hypothetical protein
MKKEKGKKFTQSLEKTGKKYNYSEREKKKLKDPLWVDPNKVPSGVISPVGQVKKPHIVLGCCVLENFKAKTAIHMQDIVLSGYISSRIIVECTLLPQARNQIVGLAYDNTPDFTHVLFIDSDQCGFTPEHLNKLLQANVDIISGITCRRDGKSITINPLKNCDIDIKDEKLVELQFTGCFFTLIKKEVFDAVCEPSRRGRIWFTSDRWPRRNWQAQRDAYVFRMARETLEKFNNTKIPSSTDEAPLEKELRDILNQAIDMGMVNQEGTELIGEDVGFCWRAREKGFRVWAHAGVRIGHIGEIAHFP